jgi:hypothetical protein
MSLLIADYKRAKEKEGGGEGGRERVSHGGGERRQRAREEGQCVLGARGSRALKHRPAEDRKFSLN